MKKFQDFLFKNTSTKQTVAKNTVWLFVGEIMGRLLKLAIVVVATRKLGIEGWGVFSYAMAFVGLFFVLGDYGINTFITKEMSKDNSSKYKYLATATIARFSLLFVFFVLALIFAPNFGKIELNFVLVLVFAIFAISESIREFGIAINRSLQKMEVESFSKVLLNLSITSLGLVLLISSPRPLSLAIAYMVGSIITTIYMLWSIKSEFRGIIWKFSKDSFKIILSFSWPIIVIGFFNFLGSLDIIMLGQMKSAVDVGIYTTAQRFVSFVSIIPIFITTSILPILSKYDDNLEHVSKIFEKVMLGLLLFCIPLTVGGIIFSQDILGLVFGVEYIPGTSTMQMLMVSVLAAFPNILLTSLVFSKSLQKIFIPAVAFGAILNIGLNFWLIPKYGAFGAALATTISELLVTVTNWYRVKKYISFSVIPKLGKIILSTIIMTALIFVLDRTNLHFLIILPIGVIVYVLCLKILKEPTLQEVFSLISKRS
jgi:O-antigen/teichoic acid export membrane protein